MLAALVAARDSGAEKAGDIPQGGLEPAEDVPAGTSATSNADALDGGPELAENVPAGTSLPQRGILAGETAQLPSQVPAEALLGRPVVAFDGAAADAVDVPEATPAMSNADALVTLADTLLASGPAHLSGADRYQGGRTRRRRHPAGGRAGGERRRRR